jgi:DNA-binding transcriptional ArsR family regulator
MFEVAVIEDPAAAEVSLDPVRARLLAELAEPGSATTLAARMGLARQKVNYHLRALERHGLVELVEERRKGSVTERVMRAAAASYVISPAALAAVAPDPTRSPDQLSARWLLAVAARLVRDVGALITGAAKARQRVATFAIDVVRGDRRVRQRQAAAGQHGYLAHAVLRYPDRGTDLPPGQGQHLLVRAGEGAAAGARAPRSQVPGGESRATPYTRRTCSRTMRRRAAIICG